MGPIARLRSLLVCDRYSEQIEDLLLSGRDVPRLGLAGNFSRR